MMTNQPKEYEPFGDEWVKEMKKFNKDELIQMLKKAFIDIQEKDARINELKYVLDNPPY